MVSKNFCSIESTEQNLLINRKFLSDNYYVYAAIFVPIYMYMHCYCAPSENLKTVTALDPLGVSCSYETPTLCMFLSFTAD